LTIIEFRPISIVPAGSNLAHQWHSRRCDTSQPDLLEPPGFAGAILANSRLD
jgi:hypothetical protein